MDPSGEKAEMASKVWDIVVLVDANTGCKEGRLPLKYPSGKS